MNSPKSKQHLDWHAAAVAGLQIELEHAREFLTYSSEFPLSKGPRRVDCLIQKIPDSPPINSPIAQIFRTYNLIDYKGPYEFMNISNFFKALSYVCSLPDFLNQPSAVHQITLTLMTHHHPRKLFTYIQKNFPKNTKDPVEKIIDGLYYIRIGLLPIQLIVLPQLPPATYLWLHCLTNHITKDMPLEELGLAYKPHEDDPIYKTFMNAVIRANSKNEGDEKSMCEALEELFASRLEAREQKGHSLGLSQGLSQGLSEGFNNGINQMSALIGKLLDSNRITDIKRVTEDPDYRDSLFAEFKL